MPRFSKKRKAAMAAMVKEKVFKAFFRILENCHPDKLAMNLFAMDEIAREAGMSTGTLYNYFRSKSDLTAYVILKSCEPHIKKEIEIMNGDMSVPDKLLAITELDLNLSDEKCKLLYIMSYYRASMPTVEKKLEELNQDAVKRITGIMEEGLRQDIFQKIPAEDLMHTFIWLRKSFSEVSPHFQDERLITQKAETMMDIFMNGVAVKCGD